MMGVALDRYLPGCYSMLANEVYVENRKINLFQIRQAVFSCLNNFAFISFILDLVSSEILQFITSPKTSLK